MSDKQSLLANQYPPGGGSHQQYQQPSPYNNQPSPYNQPSPQPYNNQPSPQPYNNQPQPSPYNNQQYQQPSPQTYESGYTKQESYAPPPYSLPDPSQYRSNDPSLPNGWESYIEPTSGNKYYCNMVNHQTTWAHPVSGAVDNPYAPAYEVPDYYEVVSKQQQQEYQPFEAEKPHYDPNSSAAPFSESSPYHPAYYTQQIAKTIDPNVLNQAQLDSIAPRHFDTAKYSQELTCGQRVCGTMGKNKCLTALSILLWIGLGVCTALVIIEEKAEIIIPVGIAYFIYFCLFIAPAGVIPLSWLCCGCSPCLSDSVVESLRAKFEPNTSRLLGNIDTMMRSAPSLVLHVECYHYEVHVTHKQVRQQDGSYKTVREEHREKVPTFRGHRQIPIMRWRDLSPPSVVIADTIEQCPSNIVSVGYKYIYELHPKQYDLLNTLKRQYYYQHCFRDDHTIVTASYSINGPQPDVDVVVKQKNCGYWCSQIFCFNPLSFFLWAYLTLLLPLMMVFRSFVRPVPFVNVKYLHLDIPNPNLDVVTLNRPRFVWRWFW